MFTSVSINGLLKWFLNTFWCLLTNDLRRIFYTYSSYIYLGAVNFILEIAFNTIICLFSNSLEATRYGFSFQIWDAITWDSRLEMLMEFPKLSSKQQFKYLKAEKSGYISMGSFHDPTAARRAREHTAFPGSAVIHSNSWCTTKVTALPKAVVV